MRPVKIGIIGGTGMEKTEIFSVDEIKNVSTPFGEPSSPLVCGKLHGVSCILLSRHGKNHDKMPSKINYRANVYSLKLEGCTHIISTTACGSLQEKIAPGHLVIMDQFIDNTKHRKTTFYGGEKGDLPGVCHIPMQNPFSEKLRNILIESCKKSNIDYHAGGTTVTIEGPRFSTYAESQLYRMWGASIVNMTTVPEVVLACEVGILYAAIGLVTDYDCWKKDTDAVNVTDVLKVMKENAEKALKVIAVAVDAIAKGKWQDDIAYAQQVASSAVMT